jgi:hypothetical protein
MFMPHVTIGRHRLSPVSVLALILIVGGLAGLFMPDRAPRPPCDPEADADCPTSTGSTAPTRIAPTGPVLSSAEACIDVGYLCADLRESGRYVVRRWRDFSGPLVVFVPAPRMDDQATALRLQRAAAAGVRLWNGQPFDVIVDQRGNREAHFQVQWIPNLGGSQIGIARTEWKASEGLKVHSIALVTQSPDRGLPIASSQIRLTAAHEMGHALGLPHSDQDRDVMYPMNTASALTARDYRTLEALYSLEDGTEIVR